MHPKGTCSAALHGAHIVPLNIRNISKGSFRAPGHGTLFPTAGKVSCCGAQNFCAALRRALEILTAATRSPRCIRPWRRSARFPKGSLETLVSRLPCALCLIRICDLVPHVRRGRFLSQRIKGLSQATAPLPLMLCHGRGVCVQRACLSLRRFAPPPSQREAGNGGRCKGSPAHIGFRLLCVL